MFEIPERFNLAEYYLDARIEEGHGDRQAVVVHGGPTLTYAEVQARSNQCAHALRKAGAARETRVLIVLPDCAEFVFTWFGTLKAGAVFAMVNPRLPSEDYAYYLEYTRAKVLVTTKEVADRIGERHSVSPTTS